MKYLVVEEVAGVGGRGDVKMSMGDTS
jgi:hypothetical protein